MELGLPVKLGLLMELDLTEQGLLAEIRHIWRKRCPYKVTSCRPTLELNSPRCDKTTYGLYLLVFCRLFDHDVADVIRWDEMGIGFDGMGW
ncbi:hypothetical protein ROHU_013811 [Labeo rohita]|uniref:Uncharacterized protein n=1 Tax=Labeo rohita TaxID=84645 RepID=A0A498L1G8_LABRO|nr:hypothetical protein ROHU_013811 [Labeo rohita]